MKSARPFWTFAICLSGLLGASLATAEGSNLPPDVVARQGDAQVSIQDIDAYAQKIPEADRAGFFDSPKRIESMIMSLLLQKQLAAEARNTKLDNDPAVKVQVQQAVDDALSRAEMARYKKSLQLPDFDALAHEYYLSHKDEFVVHGKVDVEHVLVSSKDHSEAEAKTRIGEVETAARAHPDQFDALVEKYSDDPTKKDNHGLIQDAASAKMVAPFSQAAGKLKKVGEISPVVTTEYGFHVLKLVSRQPDTKQSFEQIRAPLMEKLRNDYIERQSADHTNQLRGKAVDANPDLVASIRTRFLPPGAKLPSEMIEEANEAARKKKAAEDASH